LATVLLKVIHGGLTIEEWKRAGGKKGYIVFFGIFSTIYVSVIAYVTYPFDGLDLGVGIVMMLPLAIVFGIYGMLLWTYYRSLLTHDNLWLVKNFETVREALIAVFEDYEVAGPDRIWLLRKVRITFQKGRMTVVVEGKGRYFTSIYVGPLEDSTRDEVKRLEGVIDGALATTSSSYEH